MRPRVGRVVEAGRAGSRAWRRRLLEVGQPASFGAVSVLGGRDLLVAGEAEGVSPIEIHCFGGWWWCGWCVCAKTKEKLYRLEEARCFGRAGRSSGCVQSGVVEVVISSKESSVVGDERSED